ncbi:MAG: T9SS type A sorting domain-containing protein [Flavobacteriales bacterium]|jgi:hypothetical protein|nr:MAG: T9SS type A sorting domain-containing protein [Flavobacteriales bacterium]
MKQILTLFAFGSVGSAIAQPTLTFAGNGPTQGTSYEWHFSDHIAPGTAGPGQVWDFSSLTTDSTEVVTLVDPATTTFGAQFPTATVAEVSDGSTAYFRVGTNGVYLLGYEGEGMAVVYSDEGRFMSFPCSHQTNWTDTYSATFEDEELEVIMAGSIEGEADAYGTLILPTGTLTNVLRVHWVQEEETTSGMFTFNTVFDNYLYYVPGLPYPVVQTISATSEVLGNTITNEFTQWIADLSTTTPEFSQHGTQLQIHPVPTNEVLNYEMPGHFRGTNTIAITDASGRTVLETQYTTTNGTKGIIETGMLPAGMYQLTVIDAKGERATARFVKE